MGSHWEQPGLLPTGHTAQPQHPIADEAKTLGGNTDYSFIACSGAVTTGISDNAVGNAMVNTPWDAVHLDYPA